MNALELEQLMHTVLDGEASAAERELLEQTLAANPAARSRFVEISDLFEVLDRAGEIEPPAGLVDSVLASVPGKHLAPRDRRRQHFRRYGVIEAAPVEFRRPRRVDRRPPSNWRRAGCR